MATTATSLNPDDELNKPATSLTPPAPTPTTQTFASLQQDGTARPPAPGYTPTSTPPAGSGNSFEDALKARYQSAPTAGPQFSGQTSATPAPVYNPTVNPFSAPTPQGQVTTAPRAVPTPGTAYQAGTFAGGGDAGVNDAVRSSVMALLQNPSAYDTAAAKGTYDNLSSSIDDQYNQINQQIKEEMARRGITSSTIYGGRLQDSAAMRKTAKEQLAQNILDQQAKTLGADRASAIAAGSNFGNDAFTRALQAYTTNRDTGQQGFGNELNLSQLLDSIQRGQTADTLSTAQVNDTIARGNTADQLAVGGFNRQLGQDQYNADTTGAQFAASEDQRQFQDALQQFLANQQSNSTAFDQAETKLKDYTGFGQQSFNNQLATAQQNSQQDQQLMALIASIMGMS